MYHLQHIQKKIQSRTGYYGGPEGRDLTNFLVNFCSKDFPFILFFLQNAVICMFTGIMLYDSLKIGVRDKWGNNGKWLPMLNEFNKKDIF